MSDDEDEGPPHSLGPARDRVGGEVMGDGDGMDEENGGEGDGGEAQDQARVAALMKERRGRGPPLLLPLLTPDGRLVSTRQYRARRNTYRWDLGRGWGFGGTAVLWCWEVPVLRW